LLEERIVEIFREHNGNYGAPRIKAVLKKEGQRASKRRIGKILKRHCLESKHGRRKLAKNIYTASDERFIAENLIKGKRASASDQICQMDTSQFKCAEGKLFVNGIIDIYDKTVVAKYGKRENKELVLDTISEKLKAGRPETIHTDRGSSNISLKVKELIEANEIRRSMSAPHKPNENQYIETFWKSAKTEIGNTKKLSFAELAIVLDYYINYYNTERIHSSIGYLTPAQMRSVSRGCCMETKVLLSF
jgi:transposase InsO family protein